MSDWEAEVVADVGAPSVLIETPQCVVCNKRGLMLVPRDGLKKYEGGVKVQDAFPGLSAALREQILTGIHAECWSLLFPAVSE